MDGDFGWLGGGAGMRLGGHGCRINVLQNDEISNLFSLAGSEALNGGSMVVFNAIDADLNGRRELLEDSLRGKDGWGFARDMNKQDSDRQNRRRKNKLHSII